MVRKSITIKVISEQKGVKVSTEIENLTSYEIIGLLTQSLQGVLNSQHSKTNEKVSETE